MAAKYYAWSTITGGAKECPPGKVVVPGDYKDDWDQLVAAGAIRTQVYPKMPDTFQGSPNDYRLHQIKILQESLDESLDDLEEEEDEAVAL